MLDSSTLPATAVDCSGLVWRPDVNLGFDKSCNAYYLSYLLFVLFLLRFPLLVLFMLSFFRASVLVHTMSYFLPFSKSEVQLPSAIFIYSWRLYVQYSVPACNFRVAKFHCDTQPLPKLLCNWWTVANSAPFQLFDTFIESWKHCLGEAWNNSNPEELCA